MIFFFQSEDGIRDLVRSRGLGDVYKRQSIYNAVVHNIRKVLFIFSIFLLSSTSFSQILPNMGLNIDKNATFKTIQTAMNDYWTSQNVKGGYVLENGIEKKVPNWKLYKRLSLIHISEPTRPY